MNNSVKTMRDAKQAKPAEDVSISVVGLVATDVKGAITELFQNVSNGKTTIASAITDKGQTISGSSTFAQLATAIGSIQTGSSISNDTKLNVTAGATKTIVLENSRAIIDLCTSVLEFNAGATSNLYTSNFNNGDSSNFTFDSNSIIFDGVMKPKTTYTSSMTNLGALGTGTLYESGVIVVDDYNSISSMTADESTLILTAAPLAKVVKANGDIDVSNIQRLNSITLTAAESGNSILRIAVSVDAGVTWKGFNGTNWITVDVNDNPDFSTKGMTVEVLNALTYTQLETLRGSATTLRFAYYLEADLASDSIYTDSIVLSVLLNGTSSVCATSKYTMAYNEGTKTITYTMNTSGIYTYTWAD